MKVNNVLLWLYKQRVGRDHDVVEETISIVENYPDLVNWLDLITDLYKDKKRKLFRINATMNEYKAGRICAESALIHISGILEERF